MTRAILLAGWDQAPVTQTLREYAVISLPRKLVTRPYAAWARFAREENVEMSASWLVCAPGTGPVADAVKTALAGLTLDVTDQRRPGVLKTLDAAASRSPVVTAFATVEKRCARLRAAGKKIVFTNGVFDLFHVGHLRLLQSARALGGALVVGINSDESARRLKGRARPAVSQFARAEIVAGVRGVDFCVIFGQSDPRELLKAVRPDILVKGSEYALEGVVGRELVQKWGGRVHRVAHVQGWSSTSLIAALKGRKR